MEWTLEFTLLEITLTESSEKCIWFNAALIP
jgi:hypothetical protein